ncbi:MAG TPA: uL30 family ribosomal protein [Candidatus Acidoferrum sp.]|nr:uL30 family ribosomal protein [Candidatus Acidoferrum sp.]
MGNQLDNKIIAAIRVRGRVNVRHQTTETLNRLRLKRVNNCIVVKMNDSYYGMIKECSNYITYGEIDEETLSRLIKSSKIEADPKQILDGTYDMKALKEKLPFRLHPPRHGYKSIKRNVTQGGAVGYMGPKINGLIKRMVK